LPRVERDGQTDEGDYYAQYDRELLESHGAGASARTGRGGVAVPPTELPVVNFKHDH
jgi:hypothetical protein